MMWVVLLGLAGILCGADAARILGFFPMPTKSHHRFMQPLLKELAQRGHQVVMFTPYKALEEYPANLQVLALPDYMQAMRERLGMGSSSSGSVFTGQDGLRTLMNVAWYRQFGVELAEWMFQKEEFQRLVKSDRRFDLVFLAASYFQEPFIVLGHRFNASVVTFLPSSNWLWAHHVHGNPYDTSYIVECMHDLSERMSFRERLFLTTANLYLRAVYSLYFNPTCQRLIDKYVRYPGWETRPSMSDMLSQTSLVLANSHVALSYPYPNAPHFIDVGGLNLQPPKPLPKDLQEFMDGAKDGVIYFSLGSFADTSKILGEETGQALARLFGSLKQRVLWKWEKAIKDLSDNVRISKWFPQQDILRHKKMALFITHGGMLSLTEAVDSGVPTVGIPLAGDQMKNVRHMEYFGYGFRLGLNNITAESISWAIQEILDNPRYRENAKKRSQLYRDKPETALETAVYWTEYVIRHRGAPHLRPSVATMPWYQQAMLDIYLAIAVLLLLPVYLLYRLIKLLLGLCSPSFESDKKND